MIKMTDFLETQLIEAAADWWEENGNQAYNSITVNAKNGEEGFGPDKNKFIVELDNFDNWHGWDGVAELIFKVEEIRYEDGEIQHEVSCLNISPIGQIH